MEAAGGPSGGEPAEESVDAEPEGPIEEPDEDFRIRSLDGAQLRSLLRDKTVLRAQSQRARESCEFFIQEADNEFRSMTTRLTKLREQRRILMPERDHLLSEEFEAQKSLTTVQDWVPYLSFHFSDLSNWQVARSR